MRDITKDTDCTVDDILYLALKSCYENVLKATKIEIWEMNYDESKVRMGMIVSHDQLSQGMVVSSSLRRLTMQPFPLLASLLAVAEAI
jgi:hypothetical protein